LHEEETTQGQRLSPWLGTNRPGSQPEQGQGAGLPRLQINTSLDEYAFPLLMASKGSSTEKMIDLIHELRTSPATIFELSASTGMTKNTVATYLARFRKRGLVAFAGYVEDEKRGRGGFPATKWKWQ
jgi:transcription initiation factor IIE alpha subunit